MADEKKVTPTPQPAVQPKPEPKPIPNTGLEQKNNQPDKVIWKSPNPIKIEQK